MRGVRVGLVQSSPSPRPGDVLDEARAWVSEAARRGVELAVFPELFLPGFHGLFAARKGRGSPDAFFALAETVPGPATDGIAASARAERVHVVFTLLERDSSDGRVYNTSVMIDARGAIAHRHRKTMLTPGLEDPGLSRGATYEVAHTALGRVGLLVCADATCPEPARILALQGADLICVSSGDFWSDWRVDGVDLVEQIWSHSSASPARAVDNNVFWLAANAAGVQSGTAFFGGSRIISPVGQILAEGGMGPEARGLVIADLDLGLRRKVESTFSLVGRRRPELYGELTRGR